MKKYGVKKFMFASTGGAVYGEQEYFPADEKHNTQPKSPYGISKLAVEKYLYFYNSEFGLNYALSLGAVWRCLAAGFTGCGRSR